MERLYWLRTEHACFSRWQPEDLAQARLLWGDPQVTEYICASGVFTEEEILARLNLECANYKEYGLQYFPVFTREGELIGCCGLRPNQEFGLEFGIHLRPQFWAQGYGLELGRAILAFAKDTLHAETVFAGHNPKNLRSKGFLPKLGFDYLRDEFYGPTGLMHPSYVCRLK